jgi:MFS family permease
MLVLGGFGHFFGPILGAFVFIFLQDTIMSLTTYWRFVFGVILAVIVIFFPRGLMGLLSEGGHARLPSLPRRWRRHRRRSNRGDSTRAVHGER